MSMIAVEGLTKYYGTKQALAEVSFDIARGEVVGFLGLNGAGKTTTLKILAGLLLPTAGSVVIDGIDIVEAPLAVRSRIGYLPDTPPLYGEMTAREFLEFAAQLRGISARGARKRAEEVAEATGITSVLGKRNAHLSHGYRQRVGIAQAIVHQPALLLLDEPTAGLDPAQVVEMRQLIRALGQERTVLLSSHFLPEVSQVCDRVLVIHEGLVVAHGVVSELATKLGEHTVVVRVRGDRERALATVRDVRGVRAVEVTHAQDGQLELRVDLDGDVRAELSRALIGAGFDLIRLDRQLALEALFLQLTGQAAHA
jgi:ABC-2 type transport system ATP-binding protein